MTNDRRKSDIPPEQLEKLFEAIRLKEPCAFQLFDTIYRTRICRYFAKMGIHYSLREDLYRGILMNTCLSASKLSSAAQLQKHIARETKKSVRRLIKNCLDNQARHSLLDRLESLILLLREHTDPDTRLEITVQANRILNELRRIS